MNTESAMQSDYQKASSDATLIYSVIKSGRYPGLCITKGHIHGAGIARGKDKHKIVLICISKESAKMIETTLRKDNKVIIDHLTGREMIVTSF